MQANEGFTYREELGASASGMTVLDYLSLRYRHSTPADWRRRIVAGRVLLDGRPADERMRIRAGQTLLWVRPPWREPEAPDQFAVLHRDRDVLAVAKPRGLPTLPGGGFLERTLLRLVRRRHPEASPLHRLGRGTSGVLLFGRTPRARSAVSRAWEKGEVLRFYRALVRGTPDRDRFEVHAPIGRTPHALLGAVHAVDPRGKPASSRVRVLERREDASVVEVQIATGRTHQIRIHLAAAGHPLVGDPLYPPGGSPSPGSRALPGETGYWLHAERVEFRHPDSGRTVALTCLPPPILRTPSR